MNTSKFLIPFATIFLWTAIPAAALDFDLRFDRLAEAVGLLPEASRGPVDEVIRLIKKGENQEALHRLTELNAANPENSSLRVLTAYATLQLGNALGALEEAGKAHDAPNGNSYKCWFYGKVALLNGKNNLCKRELGHVKHAGDLPNEAKSLENEMKRKKS
jgi:predicted Zn-dependent protease